MMVLFGLTPDQVMPRFLSEIFPLLYAACFLLLLWQAFRVMAKGFRAAGRSALSTDPSGGQPASGPDRTGKLTIHPELLDADGQITREDLLTVRFGGEINPSSTAGEGD